MGLFSTWGKSSVILSHYNFNSTYLSTHFLKAYGITLSLLSPHSHYYWSFNYSRMSFHHELLYLYGTIYCEDFSNDVYKSRGLSQFRLLLNMAVLNNAFHLTKTKTHTPNYGCGVCKHNVSDGTSRITLRNGSFLLIIKDFIIQGNFTWNEVSILGLLEDIWAR